MRDKHCQTPIYAKVAYDLATRIATGALPEGVRISGRSLTSAQYGVSQETVRRAFKLLADQHILDVQLGSGAVVRSRSEAANYLMRAQGQHSLEVLRHALDDAIAQRNALNQTIDALMQQILDVTQRFSSSSPLRNYEFPLCSTSPLLGRSIGETAFRKQTGATIVAVRRGSDILLTPGPDFVFAQEDVLVVTGHADLVARVLLLTQPPAPPRASLPD